MLKYVLTVVMVAGSIVHLSTSCPSKIHWNEEGLDKDLYIQTTTVTVLAMDGRRRWLDIQKLVSFISYPFLIIKKFKIVPVNCFKLLLVGVNFNLCSLFFSVLRSWPIKVENPGVI